MIIYAINFVVKFILIFIQFYMGTFFYIVGHLGHGNLEMSNN